MNKQRRKDLKNIINALNVFKINVIGTKGDDIIDLKLKLQDILDDLDCIKSDEEDYRDNVPENLQGGWRYEASEEACDNLEEAVYNLEYAVDDDDINEIINDIDTSIKYIEGASK